MGIKGFIKEKAADIVYSLYRNGVLKMKHPVRVMSVDETIDELLNTEKSLVRFGDGEIVMMRGRALKFQKEDEALASRLREIIRYKDDGLMVSVQDIFGDLSMYIPASRRFWKDHLLAYRKYYDMWLDPDRVYASTSFSRCYATIQDRSQSPGWFEKIKRIWKDRRVVVVEGERSFTGVGNDLLSEALEVRRIIGPASQAYAAYDRILEACRRMPKDRLMLLAIGPSAKPLAEDLFHDGYRVIDIGHLNMEYNWFLAGVEDKGHIDPELKQRMDAARQEAMSGYRDEIAERIV